MKRIATTIVAALAMFALAATAQAGTLSGTAEGVTTETPDGSFTMSGTYTDASAPNGFGRYYGSYSYAIGFPTDFTTCQDNLGQNCFGDIFSYCNVVTGQITFQSGFRLITVYLSNFPLHGFDVVCQLPGTTDRVYSLGLSNLAAPGESFSRGYGDPEFAFGGMVGTSTPLVNGKYADTFNIFSLTFE
jgi:hypothetical protein